MNYEEKYNEILEWARKNKARLNGVPIEEVLPELRESEDERIRKIITDSVFYQYGAGVEYKDVLDYLDKLEKQKERCLLTKEEEYILHRIIEYLEDETCPSEWINLLHDIYCLPYKKYEEQKPAEVDESTKRLNDNWMKQHFDDYKGWNKATINGEPIPTENQSVDIPLTEWSEEDENARQNLIAHFEGKILRLSGEAKKEAVDWLKSLRPSWKPSEETRCDTSKVIPR